MGSIIQPGLPEPVPLVEGLPPEVPGGARMCLMRGSTVVEMYGEIDLTTATAVQAPLDVATAQPGALLIVDLRAVVFFDCAALTLLHRAHRRVRECGGALGVVCVRPWHRKVLAAGGVAALVPMFVTVHEALAVTRSD